jgi:histidine triad (HIT) family protein
MVHTIGPMTSCVLCDIVAKKIPSRAVLETPFLYAFHDIYPQAPVHVLLVPKVHRQGLNHVSLSDEPALAQMMLSCAEIARSLGIDQSGYRTVVNTGSDGGQSIEHLHMHILGGRPMTWPPG